jgi:putative chitinase
MSSIENVLRAVAPRANPAFVKASAGAGAIMVKWGIDTPEAQAEVLAQFAHETMGFTHFEENLNYSAPRLTEVWPGRFPTAAAAAPFAHNPKALANKTYNGRMGNRPGTDDGWNFRGSGLPHHTGESEFDRVKRRTGIDVVAKPDLLRDPASAEMMWEGACSYFVDRNALAAAKRGDTHTVTLKVNGGTIGLADRITMKKRLTTAMAGQAIVGGATSKAAKVVITEKTTAEISADTRRNATQATVSAGAGGPGSAGATKSVGTEWGVAIAAGVIVAIGVGAVAWALWKKAGAARAALERLTLETLKSRVEAAPAV